MQEVQDLLQVRAVVPKAAPPRARSSATSRAWVAMKRKLPGQLAGGSGSRPEKLVAAAAVVARRPRRRHEAEERGRPELATRRVQEVWRVSSRTMLS